MHFSLRRRHSRQLVIMRLRLLMRGVGEFEAPVLSVGAAGGEVDPEALFGELSGGESCRASGDLL